MENQAAARETWEDELYYDHRWGRYPELAASEHAKLQELWKALPSVNPATRTIITQITALEICNWRLEESIVSLCTAIGSGLPSEQPIGHRASLNASRWMELWRYYAAARAWLDQGHDSSYTALAAQLEPDLATFTRIAEMLGQPDELKALYVERFCLCLERWFNYGLAPGDILLSGHQAAIERIEQEINQREPDSPILKAMLHDGDGRLQPCHHKALRHYDIILSSIGCGTWRGAMPMRGTEGFERADLLASYLDPIAAWIDQTDYQGAAEPAHALQAALGVPDPQKRFLAGLLVSVMRAQAHNARQRAASRVVKSQ